MTSPPSRSVSLFSGIGEDPQVARLEQGRRVHMVLFFSGGTHPRLYLTPTRVPYPCVCPGPRSLFCLVDPTLMNVSCLLYPHLLYLFVCARLNAARNLLCPYGASHLTPFYRCLPKSPFVLHPPLSFVGSIGFLR